MVRKSKYAFFLQNIFCTFPFWTFIFVHFQNVYPFIFFLVFLVRIFLLTLHNFKDNHNMLLITKPIICISLLISAYPMRYASRYSLLLSCLWMYSVVLPICFPAFSYGNQNPDCLNLKNEGVVLSNPAVFYNSTSQR